MTTKSTYRLRGGDVDRRWHVLDAKDRPLGRIAGEAARLLQGKHKVTFEPHLAMGDFVIVVNAKQVDLTGNKREQKVYYRHTGYPGGLRERSFEEQIAKDPTRVIEKAVKGMLPSGVRGRQMLRMLKVYSGSEHPHAAQITAGTGARAKKRAETVVTAPAPAAAAPEAPVAAAATPGAASAVAAAPTSDGRLEGALSKYRREELDDEARRLGIEIESGWNKPDVIEAIQAHYDAATAESEE
ncbi:MAG: 50S ribosomal protein L13 [Chloroflexi bacterium]|nr:50S ribosomal protein L13 [Chloroflexota bacterium]